VSRAYIADRAGTYPAGLNRYEKTAGHACRGEFIRIIRKPYSRCDEHYGIQWVVSTSLPESSVPGE
jgi:hypothetical protein